MENKRIVIWCGNAANQRALANKIAADFNLCGIVVDKKVSLKKPSFFKKVVSVLQDRIFFRTINQSWSDLQHKYSKQYPSWPNVPVLNSDSINDEKVFEFTKEFNPDLIVVSGTSLVKAKLLSLKPSIGIVNLHTGLSPYIKGGPNCTNWCIATRQYEMIGNTIMWINEGIDSGNIITSGRAVITGAKNLFDIQWQVMEQAHRLYLAAIQYLFTEDKSSYNSVDQKSIAKGNLYLTRAWNYKAKKRLVSNLPDFLANGINRQNETIITIPIKSSVHG